MFIWQNGKLLKKEEAAISPFDHGYLYGVGLFETFRVYHGHCFLLDDHLQRLNAGLELLEIKKRICRPEAEEAVAALLEANGSSDAYIRFNVSAGAGEVGLRSEPYTDPEIIIFSKPLPPAGILQEKRGKILSLNRNTPEGVERLKSHHYLNNILAYRELRDVPGTEGIFLTKDGHVAEGIVSNVFWARGGTLFTPSLETGILNGITRQFVIELALSAGFEVREGFFSSEELLGAEEVLFTNSIQEIVVCPQIGDTTFAGREGRLGQLLHEQYAACRKKYYSRNELKTEDFS
ncbi:4-amino-4-deoxychorismate lyase [Neobacillus notoginsengisoli]|uniref:4-amino-4-deoxychorismate lyase n=1 Tax=Neobacillus notoginsengisoli TaxID=1578198 RepID=A0A417YGC1_9BACI|nr:aminodeoxychorismate lyase [Neobacillus notoginsengisoli]RHW31829.1 4-amino-4-deoxychorismate lyase [Neobacillus notoginsengisoli]